MNQISVFEPQQIGGRWISPLTLPMSDEIIARSVSASVNLLWFSLHIAAHRKDKVECDRLALMCKALVTIEHKDSDPEECEELKDALDSIDDAVDSQSDDYYDDIDTDDEDDS